MVEHKKIQSENDEKDAEERIDSLKSQIDKLDAKVKKEVGKMITKDELHEIAEIANSSRQTANNIRQEVNSVNKKSKEKLTTHIDDSNRKMDDLRKDFKNDLKIFIKNNANSGLIKSMEEIRSFAADLGERIETIEDSIDELNKSEDLPTVSRTSSKISLSRISRSESKNAPPDMSPFLADVEQLKSEIADLKSHLGEQFVTNTQLEDKINNHLQPKRTEMDELISINIDQLRCDIEHCRTLVSKKDDLQRTFESQIISTQTGVEILTKTVQTLSEFEKIFEKTCDERFIQIVNRMVELEEKVDDQGELESLRDLDGIRRSVTDGCAENEIKLCVREEIDKEVTILSEQNDVFKEQIDKQIQEQFRKVQQEMAVSDQKDVGDVEEDNDRNIDHDLIDAVESGLREYIDTKLDLFVQLSELEDVVSSQLARGNSSDQTNRMGTIPTQPILDTIEDAVGKQTQQMISLFVTKDEFSHRMAAIDHDDLNGKITECARYIEEKLHEEAQLAQHIPITNTHSDVGQTIISTSDDELRKYDAEIRAHVKSSLKHYVSASDIHGLIHEVQRLSESHKLLTDEKYDVKNRILIMNRKVAQLEQALLNHADAGTFTNVESDEKILLQELTKVIELMLNKTEETNCAAELKSIHECLLRSQNRAAENRHAYKLELSNLTVRVDYMESQEKPSVDFGEGLIKFNNLFDKVTEELAFLKKQQLEKDVLIQNLSNSTENLQTDILSLQISPPSNVDPFGENTELDKKYVQFDEIQAILAEVKSIREGLDDVAHTQLGLNPANFLTTKDLRGLVIEISSISQELPQFVTEQRVKDFFQEYDLRRKHEPEILTVIQSEIDKIWPMVDDLVVSAAMEVKVGAYFSFF